jgi:hypothetical protein
MTKGDQVVESAAEKLETFVKDAQRSGGVKGRVANALAEDPDFLRKLKPSLIVERAKGNTPTEEPNRTPPAAPPGPQFTRPTPPRGKRSGGPSPWAVLGGALAAGYAVAKAIEWRGYAHPTADGARADQRSGRRWYWSRRSARRSCQVSR